MSYGPGQKNPALPSIAELRPGHNVYGPSLPSSDGHWRAPRMRTEGPSTARASRLETDCPTASNNSGEIRCRVPRTRGGSPARLLRPSDRPDFLADPGRIW